MVRNSHQIGEITQRAESEKITLENSKATEIFVYWSEEITSVTDWKKYFWYLAISIFSSVDKWHFLSKITMRSSAYGSNINKKFVVQISLPAHHWWNGALLLTSVSAIFTIPRRLYFDASVLSHRYKLTFCIFTAAHSKVVWFVR